MMGTKARENGTISVSVDMDDLRQYYRIFGFDDAEASNAVWTVAAPRFLELFDEVGIKATFFCVAEDLRIAENVEALRVVARAGHEIANHSWHHFYDLHRRSPAQMYSEVDQSRRLLEGAVGTKVIGFRAPGYGLNAALVSTLTETGHVYDSSVLPCWPYAAVKAVARGVIKARGRETATQGSSLAMLAAPKDPYAMDPAHPFRRGHGLLQLPLSVVGGVPLLGTVFSALGPWSADGLVRLALVRRRALVVAFHGVDLLSLRDDGLDPVLASQFDIRIGVRRKRRIFRRVLTRMSEARPNLRLDQLALAGGNLS